jgi:N6-adenosine-specific RNA methylase IME4
MIEQTAPLFAELPQVEGGFACLLADPPWRFRSNSDAKPGRNARRHYHCLTPTQIATLPVQMVMAPDAWLFLWVTGPFLAAGLHLPVITAWGFTPSTIGFVWIKLRRKAPSAWQESDVTLGPGLTTRKSCEFLVLARRGNPHRLAFDVREAVFAPLGAHSVKPDEVPERIERFCPGPRLELFARRPRVDWSSWGEELAGKTSSYESKTAVSTSGQGMTRAGAIGRPGAS